MKILVVSDTHGRDGNLNKVLRKVKPIDALIHCGDVEGREEQIVSMAECPTYMVAGNNDFFTELKRELEVDLGGHRLLIAHGHNYGVALDPSGIIEGAHARKKDIVLFGHTHKPVVVYRGDVTAVNPGSLSFPRQEGRRPSYAIMEIDHRGGAHFTINYL